MSYEKPYNTPYHFPEPITYSVWDEFANNNGHTYIHGIGLVSKLQECSLTRIIDEVLDRGERED